MLHMAMGLMMGSMAFYISGGNPCRQQCAAFSAGLCIHRRHCAVNEIKAGKIIRGLRLPQFAVRQCRGLPWSRKKGYRKSRRKEHADRHDDRFCAKHRNFPGVSGGTFPISRQRKKPYRNRPVRFSGTVLHIFSMKTGKM